MNEGTGKPDAEVIRPKVNIIPNEVKVIRPKVNVVSTGTGAMADPFQPTTKLEEHLWIWSIEDCGFAHSCSPTCEERRGEALDKLLERVDELVNGSRTQLQILGLALMGMASQTPLKDWEIEAGRSPDLYPEE